jgi:uncharacterized protein YodC (DUF2158 family)
VLGNPQNLPACGDYLGWRSALRVVFGDCEGPSKGEMKAMKKMKVGDTVYLKSGSPRLTIAAIDGDQARVAWVSDGTLQETYFPLICLVKE